MKDHIYLHRAYKRLPGVTGRQMAGMVIVVALFELVLVLVHEPLTAGFVAAVAAVLDALRRADRDLRGTLPAAPGRDHARPDHGLFLPGQGVRPCLPAPGDPGAGGGAVAARVPRALVIYTSFFAMLTVASGAFFILVPELFPYDMSEFSRLYMGTELGIWFMLPLVMGLALGPVPAPLGEKALVILVDLAYSLLFGAVRFAAFVLILREASVFFMAGLFFALGPFVDFVYVVAIYALYLNQRVAAAAGDRRGSGDGPPDPQGLHRLHGAGDDRLRRAALPLHLEPPAAAASVCTTRTSSTATCRP